MCLKISASIDGGPSGGSAHADLGARTPIGAGRNFRFKFFLRSSLPRTRVHYRVTFGVLPPSTERESPNPLFHFIPIQKLELVLKLCEMGSKCCLTTPIVARLLQLLLDVFNWGGTYLFVDCRFGHYLGCRL